MIDGESALSHEFLDIPIAQCIAEIPAHCTQKHLAGKVAPLTWAGVVMRGLQGSGMQAAPVLLPEPWAFLQHYPISLWLTTALGLHCHD